MRTLRISLVATVAIGLMAFAMPAMANTIYFVRTPNPSGNSVPVVLGQFNLVVQIQGQNGADSGQCTINWNQTQCTVTNFPNKTKALVTVWERESPYGPEPRGMYGKISFWVKEGTGSTAGDQYISIPTGTVTFSFSGSASGGDQIFLYPEQYMRYSGTAGGPPNSGNGYAGVLVGKVGGTCTYSGCTVPLLPGCYSVVYKLGNTVAVNSASATSTTNDNALCIGPGQDTPYTIQIP